MYLSSIPSSNCWRRWMQGTATARTFPPSTAVNYYFADDWNFAYWNTSFANSPAPPVILRFVDDPKARGYHLALDKMTRPAPNRADWAKASVEATQALVDDSPFSVVTGSWLLGNMLELIYTGHSSVAWKFFEEPWPPRRAGQDKFLADFCAH